MLSRLRQFFRSHATSKSAALAFDHNEFARILGGFGGLNWLTDQQIELVYVRTGEILSCKDFQGAGDFEPQQRDRLAVAILAALPVLHLGLDCYRDFHTFILYPTEFLAKVEEVDDDGLVHSGRDLRSGEAWTRGPVVLAMSEVWESAQGEGYNVVVHELAHQIDQRNGEPNGFPPLPEDMDPAAWTQAFSHGYERLQQELAQGLEPSIDPYGAESPAEFFAVCCEFFFDLPDWLAEQFPDIHDQLRRFFRFD